MPKKPALPAVGPSVPIQLIERRIYLIRGQKVMMDSDLAELYGVETKVLNQAVKRHLDRFPLDFMFQLNQKQADSLRSQFVTLKPAGRGRHRKYLSYAFTEQGVAMLSSVLNSKRAIEVNIAIMRAFVKLRQMLESNEELNRKFTAVIRKLGEHDKYFTVVFDELKKLSNPLVPTHRQIGFASKGKE